MDNSTENNKKLTAEDIDKLKALKGVPFTKFLNESVNLLTAFGILNGLILFSFEISGFLSTILAIPLFVISILIWFEVLKMCRRSDDQSISYMIFWYSAIAIQFGLIVYFITLFRTFSTFMLLLGCMYGSMAGTIEILFRIIQKRTGKPRDQLYGHFPLIIMIAVLVMAFVGKYIVGPLISPVLRGQILDLLKSFDS